jgi:hypothetical protein
MVDNLSRQVSECILAVALLSQRLKREDYVVIIKG